MRLLRYIFISLLLISIILLLATWHSMQGSVQSLRQIIANAQTVQVLDRNGRPLSISYQNRWNVYDNLPLYQIPEFLQQAFLLSEDKRFYQHHGIDWQGRLRALWQNLRHGHIVSGASSVTEQVVRIIHPRPRNLWSKWIEGFEALALERNFSKADILEFYLNQVPYAANRRGVLQAARYYFDRDLSSLTYKEMLALVILARAPSSYDLYKNPSRLDKPILHLAQQLQAQGMLNSEQVKQIQQEQFNLQPPHLPINAAQFINYIRTHPANTVSVVQSDAMRTSLDSRLQQRIQEILDQRVQQLAYRKVQNAAVLVVDHKTNEILAWVIAGNNNANDALRPSGYQIDAVITPRQPGSTLKPLLYASALDKGWTAATLLEDAPLAEAIGAGLHRFHNYSHTYYGNVTLREALGNSLNIPAVHAINYVGTERFLKILHQLGFKSLQQKADFYDTGLALGDGEVTLFELVQAYSALAHRGEFRPLRYLLDNIGINALQRVFSEEAASLISHILSDPWARQLEFGMSSVLNLPVQTAVKTGTSTDYHDAWAVGYNYRYTVGVWMGNLDQSPMEGVTGAIGSALILRSVFAELTRNQETQPLYLSPKLIPVDLCVSPKIEEQTSAACVMRTEYFIPGTIPHQLQTSAVRQIMKLAKPSEGLRLAFDPRIPREYQSFEFLVEGVESTDSVTWWIDKQPPIITQGGHYLWPLSSGWHQIRTQIKRKNHVVYTSPEINFLVRN